MTVARPFRWLLALVTLVLPSSLIQARPPVDGCERGKAKDAQSQVVFRHYI
ncbi:hypothetical protein IPV08_07120 [Methylobacterium sp. SD274]|uniref:hypothetical protein n=1 Tax=Methylobacterium sp. SD274 TaxID=2782009 RepID=UPI001A9670DC|nr:hypothetical protein [Methylobacterium sp. SD274]MBO1019734.1 hypothetical protein [Methylobacterium sp. SD274]